MMKSVPIENTPSHTSISPLSEARLVRMLGNVFSNTVGATTTGGVYVTGRIPV